MNEHPLVTLIREKVTDPSHPFTLLAEFEAQPGRGDEVRAAILDSQVIRLTRREPGCMAYDLYRDAAAPDRLVLYECWRDLAALTAHLATAHFAAVGVALAGLLTTAPAVRVLTPADRYCQDRHALPASGLRNLRRPGPSAPLLGSGGVGA